MAGCATGIKDKVWQQVSSLFFYKKVFCRSGVCAESIYWFIDKGEYKLFITHLFLLTVTYMKALLTNISGLVLSAEVSSSQSLETKTLMDRYMDSVGLTGTNFKNNLAQDGVLSP